MLNLISCQKVWDRAEHNAFTDLCEFNGFFWLVFREGAAHVSSDGIIVVLKSRDAESWELASEIRLMGEDLRDPKIIVTPEGELLVTAVGVDVNAEHNVMQSYLYFSGDGVNWGEPKPVGDQHEWIWRSRYINGDCYGVSYNPSEHSTRLFKLDEQNDYQVWVDPLFSKAQNNLGYPNEHDLFHIDEQTMGCLLRRDADSCTAQLGVSIKPYQSWEWSDLGVRVGGPVVLKLHDDLVLAAVRLHDPVRTSLCSLDVENKKIVEMLSLPSEGDTSYPGLVARDKLIYCSYYSCHEGRSSIYLAKVSITEE